MALTLDNIRSRVKSAVKNNSLTSTLLDSWANESLHEIWREIDGQFGKEEISFTTVSGVSKYYPEFSINKIFSLRDVTNNTVIYESSYSEVMGEDPDQSNSGSPTVYYQQGISHIQKQPTSASAVTLVSTSGSDTSQSVLVIGKLNGIIYSETKLLNGSTNVVTTQTFDELINIIKSTTTVGLVTATTNSGAIINAKLAPRVKMLELQPIGLWPVPDGALTIKGEVLRQPLALVDTYDVPDLPERWHPLLLDKITAKAHAYLYEFDVAANKEKKALVDLEAFKKEQYYKPNHSRVIGTKRRIKVIGRLPSNYTR